MVRGMTMPGAMQVAGADAPGPETVAIAASLLIVGAALGIWIGLSLGIALYAVLLTWRFHWLTAQHYLPAIVTTAPS
jgi:hypothetical protein